MKLITKQNILFTLSLLSCLSSAATFAATAITQDTSGLFNLAANVSDEEKKLISDDIQFLKQMDLSKQDSQMNQVMHLNKANWDSLSQWLSDRVQFFVGEDLDLSKSLYEIQLTGKKFVYPNPGVMPKDTAPTPPPSARAASEDPRGLSGPGSGASGGSGNGKPVVGMQNLGGLYYKGKEHNVLLALQIPGMGPKEGLPLTSPRAGVIEIGAGLFLNIVPAGDSILEDTLTNQGNRIERLSTFFHEARHSDGNGINGGFGHVDCPPEHTFAGMPACDRTLNGAYTVGALVERMLLKNCSTCTAMEKEELTLSMLDSFSRVITITPKDPSDPHQFLTELKQMNSGLCSYLLSHPNYEATNIPPVMVQKCQDMSHFPHMPANDFIATQSVDDTPEGTRYSDE